MKFVAAVALLALVGSSMAQNAPAVQAAITAWTNDINVWTYIQDHHFTLYSAHFANLIPL